MACRLRFGAASVNLEIPAEFPSRALATATMTPLLDPTQAVRDALDAPTGSARLRDLAGGARHVLIVVPHRAYPSSLPTVLPQVLDVLQDSGVGLRQVEILVAGGVRPHLEADAAEAMIGPEIWNRVAVRQHDPDDAGSAVDLGETERGTPLLLNPKAVESGQLLILVGSIGLDALAGFSGGARLVLPGLASRAAIAAHERLGLNEELTGIDPNCRAGERDLNPLYQDALEGADKVDPDFLVHTILDDEGRMVKVVAGDWRKASELGADWIRSRMRVTVPEPRTWAVASAGGERHDATFYQAAGSMVEAARCVKDGGHLGFLAECAAGLGSDRMLEWFGSGNARDMERKLRGTRDPDALLALAVRSQAERVHIHLASRLAAAEVEAMGLSAHETPEAAWAAMAGSLKESASGYIVTAAATCLLEPSQRREPVAEERPVG